MPNGGGNGTLLLPAGALGNGDEQPDKWYLIIGNFLKSALKIISSSRKWAFRVEVYY